MKKWFLLIALLTGSLGTFAQPEGSICGIVMGPEDEPMPFVNVWIEMDNAKLGCHTNVEGYFLLSKIKPGNYTVHIRTLGYKPIDLHEIEVTAGDTVFLMNSPRTN